MNKVVPVLQIDDAVEAKRFYIDRLGFLVDFEHQHEPGFPVFMGVERGDLYIHLSEHGRGHPGSEVYIFVDDIQEWVDRFLRNNVDVESGPTKQPWGNTEVLIKDPFRNALRFSQLGTHPPGRTARRGGGPRDASSMR